MEDRRMQSFLAVADCLSFTRAAQELHVSQQAVTRQISELEAELGFPLFYRTTRHVELTPAGKSLAEDFSRISRQMESSIRQAGRIARMNKGLIRVGFLSVLSQKRIILPLAERMIDANPSQEFEIRLLDFAELRSQLLHGQLDLCITTSYDYDLWPRTCTSVLRREQFQVVYSARHPLAALPEAGIGDLTHYIQLILPQDNLMPGSEQWNRKVPCAGSLFCPDISTLLVYLELGKGFALLTRVFEGYEQPSLRYFPLPFPQAHAEIICITRENPAGEVSSVVRTLTHGHPLSL